ncbi:TetR/AcrR family transcriptional regulator [Amycolatopsis minnesotensis]|uniref:TetR/AcrR family transcriptional regulator n=1 Tax=Amycolatopsis minnesotensis TaxID=337894 RepID=A0ABP5DG06_9PSEU
MSELVPPRRRRADAERSVAAIVDAASRVLAEQAEASVEAIAAAAGVTRQTVYAHFRTREELLAAVVGRATAEALAAMDAAELDTGPAADALVRLLEASWRTFERYPVLLRADQPGLSTEDDHGPVRARLLRLVRRGQEAGEFDRALPADWLVATTIAVGHAAGAEVAAGRLPVGEALGVVRVSLLRVLTGDGRVQ